MAIHITRWRPDTCDCILEYSWDDSVSPDLRVHTPVSILKDSVHSVLSDTDAHTAVFDENARKNRALGAALTNFPAKTGKLGEAGDTVLDETKFSWSFDGSRKLLLSIPSLTNPQRTNLQSICDTQFGVGKVTIS